MNDKNIKTAMVAGAIFIAVLLVAALLVLRVPQRAVAKIKSLKKSKNVMVYEEKVDIEGLEEPFVIYFVADSHIALCDERDPELEERSKERYQEFIYDSTGADKNFKTVMDFVRKDKPDLVIFGGDMADDATYASIDFIKDEIKKLDCPYLFCMGNHDFNYGNEYFTPKAYDEYLLRYDEINEVKEGVQIKRYENFTILLLDDAGNQVCTETVAALEELKSEGKPVIIAEHVPLVPNDPDSDLLERSKAVWGQEGNGCARVLMGYGAIFPEDPTAKLIQFAYDDNSPVRLVLAGHVHFYDRSFINKNAVQVITKPAFERGVIKVTLY